MPSFFVSHFSKLATVKLVPSYLKVEVDFVDDYLDQQREIIADIRARNLFRLVESGVINQETARARLYQDQYISETARLDMALAQGLLPDGTPAIRVLMDREFDDIILIDRTIGRLEGYLHMADFGTCALDWPLMDEWERELVAGTGPQ